MNCQLKKGIFIQRTCNIPTDQKCDECGIEICRKHQKNDAGRILCHSCFSTLKKLNSNSGYYYYSDRDSDFYLWYWTMRSDYDQEYGIESFDEEDYVGFEDYDQGDYEDFDIDDEDDFLDS